MKTIFLNGDSKFEEEGKESLEAVKEDIQQFMQSEYPGGVLEYGLDICYIKFEDQDEGFLRYQLSWGGPSDEIRFYYTEGHHTAYRIEYVYLDWFKDVGIDITKENWAKWLFSIFNELGFTNRNK